MWHKPNQLNWLTNALYVAVAVTLLYGLMVAFYPVTNFSD